MLNPNNLKIDDRSIQQLLQELLKTYGQIPFIENGVEVGKWDELFKDQLLYFWVEIHETSLTWWQKERDIILKSWDSYGEPLSGPYLGKLVHTFYGWFTKAESYLQIWVIKELESCLASINFEVLEPLLASLPNNESNLKVLEQLKKRHGKKDRNGISNSKKNKEVDHFEEISNLLINCLLQIQKELRDKNWDELVSTERHPPHIGLAYGFLKAYNKVKDQLNELPKRHLDYYFKDVLKQERLKAKPDEVYLFFELNKEVQNFVLPQASVLLGDVDESGNETEFETISTSYLTNARITELKTLLVDASKEIAPLNKIGGVTGMFQNNIATDIATNYSPDNVGWHLFGDSATKNTASIGFAWASPVFLTEGGQRSYELVFELTDESALACRAVIKELAAKDQFSEEELFFNFYDQSLDIRISGLSAWLPIERYIINCFDFLKGNSNTIKLNFDLLESDEAWVSYSKDIHRENYETTYPIVELKIKGNTVYYPYFFLKCVQWKSLGINISVQECKELVMFNKHGLVDVASPFPILGVTPLKDDEFSLGSQEWVDKKITQVDLELTWLPLPKPNFATYYQDYKTTKIDDFTIKISVNEAPNAEEYDLFTLNEKEELSDTTILEGISVLKNAKSASNRLYETLRPSEVPAAFVSFKLMSPEAGFGSNHYKEELILYSQEKARDRKNKLNLLPPKAPFIPYVKSIKVNYKSNNTVIAKGIDNGNGAERFDFFHLHPHGTHKVANELKVKNRSLVPQLENRAYLYLGFEGLVLGTALCLYIKLEQSDDTINTEVDFRLEYLAGKKWATLNQDDILENSVENGLNSGMITFRIPIDIENKHPFYSRDKNWIRISVNNQHIADMGKCLLIKPNCSRVRRINIKNDEKIKLIPAGTITKFREKPKKISQVSQPMPSFGGKDREREGDLYSRVSQNLAHKRRMVRPRDFKRMLFEEFDNIAWLKVATPSEYPKSVKAGEVHIIVLPTFIDLEDMKQLNLQNEQKEAMKNFIKKHSYPGINVKIFSPQIELIEVCVDLVLNRMLETPSLDEISEIIDRTVSPWAFSEKKIENADDSFNTIDVLNSLNKLPYVWKVEVCEAVQIVKIGSNYTYLDSAEDNGLLSPSTYRSILITMAKHKIRFINGAEDSKASTTIGNMIIGTDLIIREEVEDIETEKLLEEAKSSLYLINTNEEETN